MLLLLLSVYVPTRWGWAGVSTTSASWIVSTVYANVWEVAAVGGGVGGGFMEGGFMSDPLLAGTVSSIWTVVDRPTITS